MPNLSRCLLSLFQPIFIGFSYERLLKQNEKDYNVMASCLARAFISATDTKSAIDAEIRHLEEFILSV